MKLNFKKVLLAGTAIVAASAFAAGSASAASLTLSADGLWAQSGGATSADIENAAASDNVDVNGNALSVMDYSVSATASAQPNDGGGAGGPFTLGAITDSGTGDLIVLQSAGTLSVTAASVSVGDDFNITNADAADAATTVAVTGAATVGDDFNVINVETDNAAGDVTVTVGGALTVTGATQITAGDLGAGGSTTAVTVTGNATFTEAVTIDGGANHANNTATLTLNGATNTFTGGLNLDDNTGQAVFTLSGSAAQNVYGDILAVTDGDAIINIANTSGGVTFNASVGSAAGTIGAINVFAADGNDTSATFYGNVDTTAMVLGNGAGTDTNTVTFSSSGDLTVAGTVDGDGVGNDTAAVAIAGGGNIIQTGIWGGNNDLDSVTITGSGTTLDQQAAITATAITIGSGADLEMNAAINGTVDGTSAGVGTLNVDTGATLTGAIGGTAALGEITIAAGQTLVTTAGVAATTTTLEGAASQITIGAGNNAVTTNVEATTAGQGVVNVANGVGTTTFTGNIGTSSSAISNLTVGSGAAQTFSTTGNIYATTATIDDAATLSFLGTSAQTVSAAVTGGMLVVGDGTNASDVTFSGALASMANGQINAESTARFNANATFDAGAFDNDGTVYIDDGVTLAVNAYTADAGAGTFRLVVSETGGVTTIGKITDAAGGGTDLTNDFIIFDVATDSAPLTAGTITNVIDGGGAVTVTAANISDSSFIYAITGAIVGGDLDVTIAQAQSFSTAAYSAGAANAASTILTDATLAASTNADINALQAAIAGAPSQQAFNDAVEQAMPTVDGSNVVAAMNTVNNSFAIMNDRMASLRTGDGVTGMATGNMSKGVRVWGQAFGSMGEQDARSGIDGYDYDTYGLAFGMDTENLAEDTVLGVAFTYADTEADSDNGSATNTEIDSYQLSLYGEHQFHNDIYLNGMLSYTMNDTETARRVTTGLARGEYDANTYSARAELGKDYAWQSTGATVTPKVMAHYSRYNPDSYTETGTGAALTVTGDDVDVFEMGVGVDVSWTYQNSNGSYFQPEISLGYRHDFADDSVDMTAQFVAGGVPFTVNGMDAQQDAVDVGAGFTYFSTDNWELTAEYDYEWKEDFDSHSAMARAAYRF